MIIFTLFNKDHNYSIIYVAAIRTKDCCDPYYLGIFVTMLCPYGLTIP